MMTKLLPNERLDDLQIRGYEIIQSPGRFCFGMDAVLLSAFANVKKATKKHWISEQERGFFRSFWKLNIRACIIQDWRSRRRAQIWQGAASAITDWKRGSTL